MNHFIELWGTKSKLICGYSFQAYDAEPNRNVVASANRATSWLPSMSIIEVMERENGQRRVPVPAWGIKRWTHEQTNFISSFKFQQMCFFFQMYISKKKRNKTFSSFLREAWNESNLWLFLSCFSHAAPWQNSNLILLRKVMVCIRMLCALYGMTLLARNVIQRNSIAEPPSTSCVFSTWVAFGLTFQCERWLLRSDWKHKYEIIFDSFTKPRSISTKSSGSLMNFCDKNSSFYLCQFWKDSKQW